MTRTYQALLFLWLIGTSSATPLGAQTELRIPADTAYLEPDARGARLTEHRALSGWEDSEQKILWFGKLQTTGLLQASVELRWPPSTTRRFQLAIGDQTHTAMVTAPNHDPQRDQPWARVDFGTYSIRQKGYHRIVLSSEDPGDTAVQALLLHGSATTQAHFNTHPRRNAASVHLFYPTPENIPVTAFYCEMTGLEDPVWTYYMACGWHRGYFGMQVNSPSERRIIFSVWDSGQEPADRDKVADEDRVTLLAQGPDVIARDFGNEGTGGHSHLKYPWKTGVAQKFLVTAEPVDVTHTVYAGYYYHPDDQKWMLISRWKAPKDGGHLKGLYSFSENFVGRNGHVQRKALYGNQWIRLGNGLWQELTEAKFSHDGTGKSNRLDRFMGVENGQFFLSHGGFVEGFTDYGTHFQRPATHRSPAETQLPPLPPLP